MRVLVLCSAVLLASCASKPAPEPVAEPPAAAAYEIEPLGGDGKQICGWGDTGRWECHKGDPNKKKKAKFTTKFKKGPRKEKESKLPRGDVPFDTTPVEN